MLALTHIRGGEGGGDVTTRVTGCCIRNIADNGPRDSPVRKELLPHLIVLSGRPQDHTLSSHSTHRPTWVLGVVILDDALCVV